MINTPLVSVIIPTYNRAHTLLDALDSILKQNYPNLEIIIIDDGSSDHSLKLLEIYNFGWVPTSIIFNADNLGIGTSRNIGMIHASWELITFLDSDDIWIDTKKISLQVNFLDNNLDYWFVGTGWRVVNEFWYQDRLFFCDDSSFRKCVFESCPAHTSTWMFRKILIDKIWYFWSHKCEDYEYLLRIWTITKCACLPIISEQYFSSPQWDYRKNRILSWITNFLIFYRYWKSYPGLFKSLLKRFKRLFYLR